MDTQDDKKDVQGRSWNQITKDGSSSAASMGTGGTGDIGSMSGNTEAGNSQEDTRTDDLLASGADEQGGAEGFQNPKGTGQIQTGMAGIGNLAGNGAGNRQSGSGTQAQDGTDANRGQDSFGKDDQQNR